MRNGAYSIRQVFACFRQEVVHSWEGSLTDEVHLLTVGVLLAGYCLTDEVQSLTVEV